MIGLIKWIKKNVLVVVCLLGDVSVMEGEVVEVFQMVVLCQLLIVYLVQDNEWDIFVNVVEICVQDVVDYVKGFYGLEVV